jgi:hypothetical protein
MIITPYSPGGGTGKVTWQPAVVNAPVGVQGEDTVDDYSCGG